MTSVEPYQPPQRDYAADMRKYLDEARHTDGPYNTVVAAAEIAQRLRVEDRELYYGWLEAHAESTIRTALNAVDAATRTRARSTPASVFAAAAAAAEAGDPTELKEGFLQAVYVIDKQFNRKLFRDMKAEDLGYAASRYESIARSQLFEAEFLRQVAKKIGEATVGDVFDNQTLSELHSRITGK